METQPIVEVPMARTRYIKPSFWENEDIAELEPFARLLFIGLWNYADKEGRLEDRPKKIKGQVFRFDTVDVNGLLDELQKYEFIKRYEIDGQNYIQIINFCKHQNTHKQEQESSIPPYVSPLKENYNYNYNYNYNSNTKSDFRPTTSEQHRNNIGTTSEHKKKKSLDVLSGIDLPDDLKTSEEAIRAWLEYKKEKGKQYKSKGLGALWKRFREIPQENRMASVEHSMANNWEGLFEKKGGNGNGFRRDPKLGHANAIPGKYDNY